MDSSIEKLLIVSLNDMRHAIKMSDSESYRFAKLAYVLLVPQVKDRSSVRAYEFIMHGFEDAINPLEKQNFRRIAFNSSSKALNNLTYPISFAI